MKPGDVIGWLGFNPASAAICGLTGGLPFWPFYHLSHVGIMAHDRQGNLRHYESTTSIDLACAVRGTYQPGAKAVRLEDRLATYRGVAFHFPLYRELYDFEAERLSKFLLYRLGSPYDYRGAFSAGGGIGLWAALAGAFRDESPAYFCSEEVAAALSEIGLTSTDDAGQWNPNRLVRHLRREGILKRRRRLK